METTKPTPDLASEPDLDAADALFDLDDLGVGDDALAGLPLPAAPPDEDRPPMAAHFGKLG